jgi:hypothetical protein
MTPVPDHAEMLDLIAVAALGNLSASDLQRATAHLATCEECRAEYAALRPSADALGIIAEVPIEAERSARMKKRLLDTIRLRDAMPTTPAQRRSSSGAIAAMLLATAASLVFALISTVQNIGLRSDLASVQRRNTAIQTQLADNQRSRSGERQMIADFAASDAARYPVAAGDVIRRGERVYFVLRSLAPPPKGHVYQAWTLARGATSMSPSVTFQPNVSGVTIVALPENATLVTAVALSIEPTGGSKAPTTKPTFIQTLT